MKHSFRHFAIASFSGLSLFAVSCNNSDNTSADDSSAMTEIPVEQPIQKDTTPAPPVNTKRDTVIIKTTLGSMTVALYGETPKHKANFLKLMDSNFYNGTLFHRVKKDFMIQGGDPLSKDNDPANDGTGGPGYEIEAEILPQFTHKRGTLATANNGNPMHNSSGSQFFINTVDNDFLNGSYTVFGEIIEGMDVLDKIAGTPLTNVGPDGTGRPARDVKIISVTRKENKPAKGARADKKEKKADGKTGK